MKALLYKYTYQYYRNRYLNGKITREKLILKTGKVDKYHSFAEHYHLAIKDVIHFIDSKIRPARGDENS